jgi:NitT/TauT family transport system substrate-binding protein
MRKGFFAKQGIKVEPVLAAGGAAIVPAVVSGANQIGFSNNVSLFIASSKGLPLKIISEGVGISPSSSAGGPGGSQVGYCEVLAKQGSGITEPKDLAGKTIAVNTLNNIGDVTIKAALDKHGVKPGSVEFSELGFPDMLTALNAGRVDAAWECEPFVSQGMAAGDVPVLNNYADTDPHLSVATYFAAQQWLDENADTAKGFTTALHQAFDYASAHPDEASAATLDYTKIPKAAAMKVGLPEWRSQLNRESLTHLADLTAQYGLTEKPADLDSLIREP